MVNNSDILTLGVDLGGTKICHGDPLAKRLVDETCNYLSAGIVGIVNAFNPCLLVLGGGVIEGLPIFIEVEQITRERALKAAL